MTAPQGHTPGPWAASVNEHGTAWRVQSAARVLCTTTRENAETIADALNRLGDTLARAEAAEAENRILREALGGFLRRDGCGEGCPAHGSRNRGYHAPSCVALRAALAGEKGAGA